MEHRPPALWPLLALMAFLTVGGLYGGVSFLVDPTGAGLGAELGWLERTPVDDFFWPGVFIITVFGVGTIVAMAGLTWRASPGPLRQADVSIGYHWSWVATITIAITLIVWIAYELLVLPATMILQPILIGVGVAVIALCTMPSMRAHYRA